MKTLLKSLAFVALSAATFTACNEDACKDVECGTYGTCNEGTCLCEAYYETNAEGKCEVLQRAKFLSATGGPQTYAVNESCTYSTGDYTSIITAGTELNEVRISNVWDSFANAVVATVSGNTLTIASQTPDQADGYTIEGSGTMEGNTLTLNVTITNDEGNSVTCTFTYVK